MSSALTSINVTNYSTAIFSAISIATLFFAYRFLTSDITKSTPVLPASKMKTIVILGGSYGALGTAHKLLKDSASTGDIKVILIAPNTHMYWNIASVRGIVPGGFRDDQLFAPIAPGFKQYKDGLFEHVIGTATGVDFDSKKVTISSTAGTSDLSYDVLVVATGAKTNGDAPWKAEGTYEETRDKLHEYQDKVKNATSIVIVGGGATGVETAGDIGSEYGTSKKITLIASGNRVLETAPENISKKAAGILKELNVEVKFGTKVVDTRTLPSGQTEIALASGETMTSDLYLPTMGLIPNASFVPSTYLDARGHLLVDQYLRVKDTQDVWAVGDVSSIEHAQLVNTQKQAPHLAKNIGLVLKGKNPTIYKTGGSPLLAVPIGRKKGTGHFGSWGFPGFVVNMVKGKTYFTENLPKVVNGSG